MSVLDNYTITSFEITGICPPGAALPPMKIKVYSNWEIDSKSHYPYCKNCGQMPLGGVMSQECPYCNAIMRGTIND